MLLIRLNTMGHFLPNEYSLPVSYPTPVFGDGMEADLGSAPPFMPCDQYSLSPAGVQATSQNNFPDSPFHRTGPSQTAAGDSSRRTAPAFPRRTPYPMRNNSDIGHSPSFPIPGPSESSAHGSQQASRYDVCPCCGVPLGVTNTVVVDRLL